MTSTPDPSYYLSPAVQANPGLYCTVQTCPLSMAWLSYLPSVGGNVLYAVLFVLFLLAQIFLGMRYRTWGFLAGMFIGILLEILGYIGRLMMHSNPFLESNFLL